jgi:hypothetical protein
MTMYSTDISVFVPISERQDDIRKLYNLYARELTNLSKSFEFIFIIDGNFPVAFNELVNSKTRGN